MVRHIPKSSFWIPILLVYRHRSYRTGEIVNSIRENDTQALNSPIYFCNQKDNQKDNDMKKEQFQENGISRRGFLKRTALAGAATCSAPAMGKVTAAGKALNG